MTSYRDMERVEKFGPRYRYIALHPDIFDNITPLAEKDVRFQLPKEGIDALWKAFFEHPIQDHPRDLHTLLHYSVDTVIKSMIAVAMKNDFDLSPVITEIGSILYEGNTLDNGLTKRPVLISPKLLPFSDPLVQGGPCLAGDTMLDSVSRMLLATNILAEKEAQAFPEWKTRALALRVIGEFSELANHARNDMDVDDYLLTMKAIISGNKLLFKSFPLVAGALSESPDLAAFRKPAMSFVYQTAKSPSVKKNIDTILLRFWDKFGGDRGEMFAFEALFRTVLADAERKMSDIIGLYDNITQGRSSWLTTELLKMLSPVYAKLTPTQLEQEGEVDNRNMKPTGISKKISTMELRRRFLLFATSFMVFSSSDDPENVTSWDYKTNRDVLGLLSFHKSLSHCGATIEDVVRIDDIERMFAKRLPQKPIQDWQWLMLIHATTAFFNGKRQNPYTIYQCIPKNSEGDDPKTEAFVLTKLVSKLSPELRAKIEHTQTIPGQKAIIHDTIAKGLATLGVEFVEKIPEPELSMGDVIPF